MFSNRYKTVFTRLLHTDPSSMSLIMSHISMFSAQSSPARVGSVACSEVVKANGRKTTQQLRHCCGRRRTDFLTDWRRERITAQLLKNGGHFVFAYVQKHTMSNLKTISKAHLQCDAVQ